MTSDIDLDQVQPQVLRLHSLPASDEGGLGDLVLAPDERPALQANEVRVGLLAMPINPADVLQLQGRYGHQPEMPFVPGHEALGVVLEVGAEVTHLQTLDWVIPLAPSGYWRDEMVLPAKRVMVLPAAARTSVAQVAMLKANPATALVMLQHVVPLEPGAVVIQNAANSAVGQCVNAVAAQLGLRVINVVRRADAIPAGASAQDWLVDDGQTDLSAAVHARTDRAPALALDAVGGAATQRLARTLEVGATVLTYGLLSGEPVQVDAQDLVFRGVRLQGFWLAQWFQDAANRGLAQSIYPQLLEWQSAKVFDTRVSGVYALSELEGALGLAQQERRDGKVLFKGAWLDALNLRVE